MKSPSGAALIECKSYSESVLSPPRSIFLRCVSSQCAGQRSGHLSWMLWWHWRENGWRRGRRSCWGRQGQGLRHRLTSTDRSASGASGCNCTAGWERTSKTQVSGLGSACGISWTPAWDTSYITGLCLFSPQLLEILVFFLLFFSILFKITLKKVEAFFPSPSLMARPQWSGIPPNFLLKFYWFPVWTPCCPLESLPLAPF